MYSPLCYYYCDYLLLLLFSTDFLEPLLFFLFLYMF